MELQCGVRDLTWPWHFVAGNRGRNQRPDIQKSPCISGRVPLAERCTHALFPLQFPTGLHSTLQKIHAEGEFPPWPAGGAAGDAAREAAGVDVQVHLVEVPRSGERWARHSERRRSAGIGGGAVQGRSCAYIGHPGGFPCSPEK